jgi:hypothetical protein
MRVVGETQVTFVAAIESNITFEFRPNLTPWIVTTVPPIVDPFIADMPVTVGGALFLILSTSDVALVPAAPAADTGNVTSKRQRIIPVITRKFRADPALPARIFTRII